MVLEDLARSTLGANLVAFTEPFLNDYFRANFYHLKGRDLDLVVDAGMGLAPLVPELDLTPGKPVLAVATHIHADHVGSLHEFTERAGPRLEAEAFATMEDRWTFADEFRALGRAGDAAALCWLEGRGLPHRARAADAHPRRGRL